ADRSTRVPGAGRQRPAGLGVPYSARMRAALMVVIVSLLGGVAWPQLPPSGASWCPMHPDVRGASGERCPICGMALVPRPADPDAYWLRLARRSRATAARPQRAL